MEANANTPTLFDVVKQFDKIEVDDYQRTYAWTRDEIEEFFTDLKECADEEDGTHFFGTLILQSHDNSLATVVDGQQRLTTTFILVAALRDAIMKLGIDTIPGVGDKLPVRVIDKTWKYLYVNDNVSVHRFHSNRFLRDIMAKSVVAKPEAQQELRARDQQITLAFRKAIGVVRGLVKADLDDFHSPEEKLLRINDLLDTLMENFLVLRVITSSVSESLEIFLTLNNRGLPLGPSDLVRGEIMSRLAIGETEPAQRRMHTRIFEEWKDITENVKEPEVFLRHYLVATGKDKVQKKKVYDRVIERLKPTDTEDRKARANDFWGKLIRASEVYNQIISPKMGGDCQYQLELLDGLIKSHRILLLNVLGKEGLDSAARDEIVRLVFTLAFRWVMGGGNAQKLEDKFQKWGFDFMNDGGVDGLVTSIKLAADELTTDVPKYLKEEGDSGFVGRAVLHAVNRALTPGANPVALDGTIHLEHIAPQSVTDHWQEALFEGDSSQFEKYDSTISEIGNLTLLDFKLNLQAQQLEFGLKKDKYTLSTIKITRDLLTLSDWSENSVKQRTKWLAAMFDVIWSVNPSGNQVKSFNDWLANN
jgi:hypothetical protein